MMEKIKRTINKQRSKTVRPPAMNIKKASNVLLDVVDMLNRENIAYTLEGGTLLGIVRDGELLPWDHDVDLAIDNDYAESLDKLRWKFYLKGYRVTMRKYSTAYGPINRGDYRIFKVKPLGLAFLKIFSKRFEGKMLILDIFVKKSDANFTYWQAKGKIMRTERYHYDKKEWLDYRGTKLSAPQNYKKYLTAKYGDWSSPTKDWDCGEDERTIVYDIKKKEIGA